MTEVKKILMVIGLPDPDGGIFSINIENNAISDTI